MAWIKSGLYWTAVLSLYRGAVAQDSSSSPSSSHHDNDSYYPGAVDGNGNPLPSYSPARPPAIPLAVRSPYTSAWSTTAGNSTLNSAMPIFWPGNALGWEGIVVVDGISYEYLGTGSQSLPTLPTLQVAVPQTVTYDSQYSNFTFHAGPVEILASFFSPVTPKDLCRTSIPLSYLTTRVTSRDGRAHHVRFYSDVNGAWISYESNQTLTWALAKSGGSPSGTGGPSPSPSPSVNGTGNATTAADTLYSWIYALAQPYTFGEEADFPQWGNFTYSTSPMGAHTFSFASGFATDLRYRFVHQLVLDDVVDADYRGWGTREPVFAFAHDVGHVSTSAEVRYTIGAVQTPMVRYLHLGGITSLLPWWAQCYGGDGDADLYALLAFHWNDFAAVAQLGADFEAALRDDVAAYYEENPALIYSNVSSPSAPPAYYPTNNGSSDQAAYATGVDQYGQDYIFDPNTAYGFLDPETFAGVAVPDVDEAEAYYSIVALSARQIMGAYVYAIPPSSTTTTTTTGARDGAEASTPLMFQKEISSDGNVNTVDVLYPATPFFLWANPDMLKWTLEALYQNQEGGFYPNGYSMHDLGSNFPNATGHVEGNDEYMPVEESGNMILMSYAYYKFSGDSAWLTSHYALLRQWARYLTEFALVPSGQLSTDDFAGTLVNQTNLALKGIVGLQAMGAIARLAGEPADAANFSATARDYYDQWLALAVDPSHNHTMLAYEWRSSWGLLYNTFFDKLLNLGLVTDDVYEMQSAWYAQVSQVFGVPLDNRHHYTKSDWQLWTAATCAPSTRRLFVNGLAYWLNYTSTSDPFSDLYETIDTGSYPEVPNEILFKARPVVGGHFALLALYRAGLLASDGADSEAGSVFAANSTDAVGSGSGSGGGEALPTQASSDLWGPSGGAYSVTTATTTVMGGGNGTSSTLVTETLSTMTETLISVSSVGVLPTTA